MASCTGLEALILSFVPKFSMDTHSGFVKELLTSWAPQHSEPELTLSPRREDAFTRQGCADLLRGVGMIAEEWLQTIEEPSEGDSGSGHRVQYKLVVDIYDWEAQKEWWRDHLISCFPNWLDLGRLSWSFDPRKCTPSSVFIAADSTFRIAQTRYNKWAPEQQPRAPANIIPKAAIEPDVDTDTSSFSKVKSSPRYSGMMSCSH